MMRIDASCHCGAIRFAVEAVPDAVNECTCSICRRYGALWAYYDPARVHFATDNGETDIYMWGERRLELHRCRACGCVTHWRDVDRSRPKMGVNTRMMAQEVLAGVPVLLNGKPVHRTAD
jgi:hypothetical protein